MPVNTPDLKGIKEFKKLRYESKLSFRAIARVMRNKKTGKDKPLQTLHRWDTYLSKGKVSTTDLSTV